MFRKIMAVIVSFFLLVNIYGCAAMVVGAAAGGAGTAAWLSGKLNQEVNGSFEKSLSAVKLALKSLNLNVTKETVKDNVAQIMSNYTDGKIIWVDIHRVSSSTTRVEIRVGVAGDQAAAHKILGKITEYL